MNPRVQSIWYQPPSEGVVECVGLEVGVPKRFLRIYPTQRITDYGWVMHESAFIVWGADEGGSMAARVGDLLGVHMQPHQLDGLRQYLKGVEIADGTVDGIRPHLPMTPEQDRLAREMAEQQITWDHHKTTQEALGVCPHSGETFRVCKATDLCDCFDYPEHEHYRTEL